MGIFKGPSRRHRIRYRNADEGNNEECGIKSFEIIKGFKAQTSYISSKGTKRLFVLYLIRIADSKIKLSEEHKDYRWVNVAKARKLLPHISWIKLLIKADKYIFNTNRHSGQH